MSPRRNYELVSMETTDMVVARQRPHEIAIPPSSPSDTLMTSEAGGDPTRDIQARGDPELSLDAVNQNLRDELEELQRPTISKCILQDYKVRSWPLVTALKRGEQSSTKVKDSMKRLKIMRKYRPM